MNNKLAIESLSMDLLRVSLNYHKGSDLLAKRFSLEALKRIGEIDARSLRPYFVNILKSIVKTLSINDSEKIAEDALMYSTLCKNYAKKFC